MTLPTLIITRHSGAVEWLRRRGITGEVVVHASPAQVKGRAVVGVLPLSLACLAETVTSIDLPNLPPQMRGKDLSADQMDACGAVMVSYRVEALGYPPYALTPNQEKAR